MHNVDAIHINGWNIGYIEWSARTGEIETLFTSQDVRRRGLATKLWFEALRLADVTGITKPVHSSRRTPDGDAWAKSLGDKLPRLQKSFYNAYAKL
jgi:GNAT superfamily N-acetyltransferase